MSKISKPDAVLIVDDEKSIRITLKKILEREGYYVETAPDFPTAKKNIDSLSFDLYILDIILPTINGIEFLVKLREEMHIDTPVIFITGEPNIKTSVEALRLGAFDYIEKPVRKHDILKVVKHALDRSRMEKEIRLQKSEIDAIKEQHQKILSLLASNREALEALLDQIKTQDVSKVEGAIKELLANLHSIEELFGSH